MSSDLLLIGQAGGIAARRSLELTAQNIANASNPDYARRRIEQSEVIATGSIANFFESALGGVRIDGIQRGDAIFLQGQARRTSSDLARADAELAGLQAAESAIEQAGVFNAIVEFEASLARLQSDPLNGALREAVLESGRSMAGTLNLADASLAQASEQLRFEANAAVDEVNLFATELARLNAAITRSEPGTSGYAALMDQRDAQLSSLSERTIIAVSYKPDGTVDVRLGDASGALLVQGAQTDALGVAENPDGTLQFAVGATLVSPASGSLSGMNQALVALRDYSLRLDGVAMTAIQQLNDAQANGAAADGSNGLPFFSGAGAAEIAVSLADGSGIATAPAGSAAGSRSTGNLEALRAVLAANGPAAEADRLIFDVSNAVRSRSVTRDAVATIADGAQSALVAETGVDLEEEALNLVRFQQAFQASSRVIQAASDIFDTILGIR